MEESTLGTAALQMYVSFLCADMERFPNRKAETSTHCELSFLLKTQMYSYTPRVSQEACTGGGGGVQEGDGEVRRQGKWECRFQSSDLGIMYMSKKIK